jgi:hypothetical protein
MDGRRLLDRINHSLLFNHSHEGGAETELLDCLGIDSVPKLPAFLPPHLVLQSQQTLYPSTRRSRFVFGSD